MSNVATRILIRSYKFRTANKTLIPLRIFVSRNSSHPLGSHVVPRNLVRQTLYYSEPPKFMIKEGKEIFHSFEIVLAVEFLRSNNGLEEMYVYKMG